MDPAETIARELMVFYSLPSNIWIYICQWNAVITYVC